MHFAPLPYLDPGSGSFLLQLALAALLGLGVASRAYWAKIKGWFGYSTQVDEDDVDDTAAQADKPLMVLPTKCPSCGAAIRSNEVKWLDDTTAECSFCKSPVRAATDQ